LNVSTADFAKEKLAVPESGPPAIIPVIFEAAPSVTASFPPSRSIMVPFMPVTHPFTVTVTDDPKVSMPSASLPLPINFPVTVMFVSPVPWLVAGKSGQGPVMSKRLKVINSIRQPWLK